MITKLTLSHLAQKFQDLEEERIDFLKASLWAFANVASTVCVSDDAVSEPPPPASLILVGVLIFVVLREGPSIIGGV